ncbi:IS3 family transposase [Marinitoga sp. 1138]
MYKREENEIKNWNDVEDITFYNEKRFQKRLKCLTPTEYRNQALHIA